MNTQNGAGDPDSDGAPDLGPDRGRLARLAHALRRHLPRNALIAGLVTAAVVGVVEVLAGRGADRILPPPAPAPTCPGTDCDGRNPETTTCGADAGSHRPAEGNPATLEVRYNPRCQAVWGRILTGEPGDRVTVHVVGGGTTEAQIEWNDDQFTRMLAVDPAGFTVEVCAVPGGHPDRRATWQRYCVEATHDTDFSLR
ncbi:DUF2690 domain-containing protein [Streptomyces sp. 8K308]|uniref:DUF2690 domain-containing protein n=1 Tax=Streptomyces sp. 8K308 TaxID=2530388 RepID=UPI00140463C8|nr:DUF2690 domain-containing protein [Streptomyces sp. 8K308]